MTMKTDVQLQKNLAKLYFNKKTMISAGGLALERDVLNSLPKRNFGRTVFSINDDNIKPKSEQLDLDCYTYTITTRLGAQTIFN